VERSSDVPSSPHGGELAVPGNFYTNNQLLLQRAMTAAIGLRLPSLYRDSLSTAVPSRFHRLLKQLDEQDAPAGGEDAPGNA
jgi:hypothetical protein